MHLDEQLQSILRVPQSEDVEKIVMLSCERQYKNVSIMNSLEKMTMPCLQPQQILQQHRKQMASSNQNPSIPPSTSTSVQKHRRRNWGINTIIGHILLLVFHLIQWQKISQTKGVSAEYLDEDIEFYVIVSH